jgi:hypothetical protein
VLRGPACPRRLLVLRDCHEPLLPATALAVRIAWRSARSASPAIPLLSARCGQAAAAMTRAERWFRARRYSAPREFGLLRMSWLLSIRISAGRGLMPMRHGGRRHRE